MALFEEKKKGFFGRMSERIGDVILRRPKIDEDFMDEVTYQIVMLFTIVTICHHVCKKRYERSHRCLLQRITRSDVHL